MSIVPTLVPYRSSGLVRRKPSSPPSQPLMTELDASALQRPFRLGGHGCLEYNRCEEVGRMIYRIALRASEEGYSVSVPGLPGCWSQGSTETEALENIREAIPEYPAVAVELTQDAEIREVDVAV